MRIFAALASLVLSLSLLACRSGGHAPPFVPEVRPDHVGPAAAGGGTGPGRFVDALLEAFDADEAMDVLVEAERYYRSHGSTGYTVVAERVEAELRAAGFGSDPRLAIEVVDVPIPEPAWSPKGASLALVREGEAPVVLHSFDDESDKERVMLPVNTPAADLVAPLAFRIDDNLEGKILVTEALVRTDIIRRCKAEGAVGILSSYLEPFNMDPDGGEAHLDSVQYRTVASGFDLPVCQISPRTRAQLEREHVFNGSASVALKIDVEFGEPVARTVIAKVMGQSRPAEVAVVVSHIDQPGASDNASGIASVVEGAASLAELLRGGELPWPDASVVFLFGPERDASDHWLDGTDDEPLGAVVAIQTGDSYGLTGAPALLERHPDPGALVPLPPDEHTAWGAGTVAEEDLDPNGISVIARCAMADVGARAEGGWHTADHPWEGGTDHDEFIDRGIPAVLFWHFAGFSYHTNLDTAELIDPLEVERNGVAVLATALAIADAEPGDLARYLESVDVEQALRVSAAEAAGDGELARGWEGWCAGARTWFEALCGTE